MKIIAHRGIWHTSEEKNAAIAFKRCIDQGFGIETDVRDHDNELIISHDAPVSKGQYLSFDTFLEMYTSGKTHTPLLAINIKSDGIQDQLKTAIEKYNLQSYFTFDMSFPSLYFGYQGKLKFFSSVNEYLQEPLLYNKCSGIWLDAYEHIWYSSQHMETYLNEGKEVCIVSPELHNREHTELWRVIKGSGLSQHPCISICTDLPLAAQEFFS